MACGREVAARHDIHLLMDETVTIAANRFAGGTLWTDFRLGSASLTQAMRSVQGRKGMVGYRWSAPARPRATASSRRRSSPCTGAPGLFSTPPSRPPHDGPTVVVTHHAPHPDSLPDPHGHLRWCDASDLRDLIHARGPDLWVHGHVHRVADYRVDRTRIVCNPRGHFGEISGFTSDLAISSRP